MEKRDQKSLRTWASQTLGILDLLDQEEYEEAKEDGDGEEE
jgi:hypothetical protein